MRYFKGNTIHCLKWAEEAVEVVDGDRAFAHEVFSVEIRQLASDRAGDDGGGFPVDSFMSLNAGGRGGDGDEMVVSSFCFV